MSILAVESDIYRWLQSLEIVKDGKRNSQNKIQLTQNQSNRFYDGLYISRILKKIIEKESQVNVSLITKMKSIKQNSTPAIRLYNWNLITDVLKHYKYNLNYVYKSKILNLQSQPIQELLVYLKGIYHNQNGGQVNYAQNLKNNALNPSFVYDKNVASSLQVEMKGIAGKKVTDAKNILQFFIISLSKNLKLSAQQTLNLFLDNNKYLAHLLVKGIKDSFQLIQNFQNEILNNMSFIVLNLFSIDQQKSIQFFCEGLKSCLISKDLQVATKCFDIFHRMGQLYSEHNLDKKQLFSWLRKQGINTLLFSSKRHKQTLEQAIQVSYKFVQSQLFQFIRPTQKSPLWNNQTQKLRFYNSFLFVAQNRVLQQFSKSTCLMQWSKFCLKSLKRIKDVEDLKILIKIFQQKWVQFPQVFENQNSLAQNFISFLKGTSFSNDFMLFIESIKTMFDLMQILGRRKNNYAPVFYKTLVNCLSFESSEQRVTFIVHNFISSFKLIDNLPGSLLVQPLLKSIQRNCTVSSLQLCKMLVIEQKVKQQDSIEIIDVLTKVIMQDINQGPLAIQYVFECIAFLDVQIQNQLLIKNSQLFLSHFYSLSKTIKRNFQDLKENFKRYQNQSDMKEGNSVFLSQVKKYLLIQNLMKFLGQIMQRHSDEVKNEIEEALFITYLKVKNELQKQNVALILRTLILKKYFDTQEQLVAVIDKYQEKYNAYVQILHKKSIYLLDSEEEPSPKKDNFIVYNRIYASKSSALDDSSISNSKKIKPELFKPQKSALKYLEALKDKIDKTKMMTEQNQKKKDMMLQKNDLVRSILNERRLVKFGVKSQSDIQYKYLLQFDSVRIEKNINGLPNIQLISLQNEEEDIFVNDVNSLIKKFRKVWRFLFFKYSTFGSKNNSELKIQQKINMTEVWKMHRQYGTDSIKKQQAFGLIRNINQNMKRRNEIQNLTYLGFQEYIVQFCIYAYNKIGLTNLSPGQKVLKLINQLKTTTEDKGGNVDIFQNPQQVYFQQTQVIKEFNKRLRQNPDYILPQGYKKFKQTQFLYEYQFTEPVQSSFGQAGTNLVSNKNYFDVVQVLDAILFQNQRLGFHIVQPKTTKTQKTLAKPALFQQINEKMKNYKGGYMMPKRQVRSTYIEKVNLFKPQFHPLIQFSLGIKLGLATVPLKYKGLGQQVAYWMDDMLDAIQNGSSKVVNKALKQIQNQAIRKKKQMTFKFKHQMKQKQRYYKQRSQSVRSQFQKIQVIKEQNNRKKIHQIKLKQSEQKDRQQKQMKKKLRQFQKAKQYFSQKQQKQEQKILKQRQSGRVQKEQYKKNVQEYFKKKKQELQQKQLNFRKDKQYQMKKGKQDKQKKKQLTQKVYFSVLRKDQEALEKIQTFKDKYQEFCNSSFVNQQLEINRKSLSILFQLLIKYQKSKISATDRDQISQNTFNFFTLKFKIVPFILQKNILTKIFNSIGKEQSNKAGFGLSYRGFEEALLKIIIKSKNMLNQLVQRRRRKQTRLDQPIIEDENQDNQNQKQFYNKSSLRNSHKISNKLSVNQNLAYDYLFDPEDVTQQTIRQFMLFLNLPDDKLGVQQRYREAIESKHSKPAVLLRKQLKQSYINE